MTAPLFNLPIMSPITGPSTATTAQAPAEGFEALLAGLFGEPAELVAGGLLTDKHADEDAAPQPGLADGPTTPPQSAQAQVLAAMLATAPPQIVQTAPDAANSATPDGDPASGAAPPSPIPFLPAAPAVSAAPTGPAGSAGSAGSAAPSTPLNHKAAVQTAQATPQADFASLAQPETQAPVAPAATDPDVAVPAAVQAPEIKTSVEPPLAAATSPAAAVAPPPTPVPATSAATVTTPQATTPTPSPSAPVAAPPIGPQPTTQVMARAEPLATEAPVEVQPVQPEAAPRGAKSADAARRGPTQAGSAPLAPTDDSTLPTAVAPVANASTSGGTASSLETETITVPREAKAEAAPDAPNFQAPAPVAAAHVTAPTAHAAPVPATSETVANLTAQISKKLEGQSTKFEVELNPAGLGRVSVSVEIAASGKMTAAMSFDTPQAAAELRARSHELQRALEQAGFDLSGGLSFDVAGDRGDSRGAPQHQQNDDAAWRGRAFQAVLAAGETVEAASSLALNYGRRSTTGVDVRI